MKAYLFSGLSEEERHRLWEAFVQRAELDQEARESYPIPEFLHQRVGLLCCWVFLTESHDYPVRTAVGVLMMVATAVQWIAGMIVQLGFLK
ncbi:MAG: hypothetical protein G3H99_06045 [Ferrovum sp.]|nr:hypothetical protein [Ferrovum sp.]NDU86592.1 hypothetical protein [Ferrovum sp.]